MSLFAAGTAEAVAMTPADIPKLQRFYERNPSYFVNVGGRPAQPNEAHDDFHSMPPAGWTFKRKWMIAFVEAGEWIAIADVIEDLLAPNVWHVGRQHDRSHTVLVLGKPLGQWSREEYLERVPRDRPDHPAAL